MTTNNVVPDLADQVAALAEQVDLLAKHVEEGFTAAAILARAHSGRPVFPRSVGGKVPPPRHLKVVRS
jgi:hypothetical protein